jgi:molecular chaperone DnaJ
MPRDYYEILGLDRAASAEDIKKAFRRLGKQYHPDVSTESNAQEIFQEINEAYQILSDPQKRSAYDRFGHAGVKFDGGGFNAGFGNFEDIFEDLMGAFGARVRTSGGKRRARQGRDLRHDLRLSFEQAAFGAEMEIEITRYETCPECNGSGAEAGSQPITCPDCNGSGQKREPKQTFLGYMMTVTECPRCKGEGKIVEKPCRQCTGRAKVRRNRHINVSIPAGVDDGTQIRLSGEGEPGEFGGPPGNLWVAINVSDHAYFKRRNSDVLLEININIAQAALGAKITVPTLHGDHEIKIDPGTQTGTVLTLREKGIPKLRQDGRSSGRGDQLCIVNVAIPTKLSAEQRRLFEELGKTLGTDIVGNNSGKSMFDRVVNFFAGN